MQRGRGKAFWLQSEVLLPHGLAMVLPCYGIGAVDEISNGVLRCCVLRPQQLEISALRSKHVFEAGDTQYLR